MKTGIHKGVKITGCFAGISKEKKTPYISLEFENAEGDTIEHDFYITENTKERVVKTFVELGFIGKSFNNFADPKYSISDLFGEPKDVISLTVIEEEYSNNEGAIKTRQLVQWVNVGERQAREKLDSATAIKVFGSLNLDGMLMLEKKAEGKKPEKTKVKESEVNDDGIPF